MLLYLCILRNIFFILISVKLFDGLVLRLPLRMQVELFLQDDKGSEIAKCVRMYLCI